MKKIYSHIYEFRGSHYEFGRMQGEQLRDSLIVANRERQWEIRRPRFSIDVDEAQAMIERFAPHLWDELRGMQDVLGWDLERIILEFGGYRVPLVKSGCSIFTTKNYLVRNYDYHPKTYEGRYILFAPTDGGYAMIGPTQKITGRMDGMNEKGLAIGYNFMHRKKPGPGFVCWMIGRLLLESCATVEEAIDLLQAIPHRHSFSYIVLDTSGDTYIVEATPRDVVVRKSNMCTNHFELLEGENRRHLDDSLARLQAIEQQHMVNMPAEEAYRMMNDASRGVFSDMYSSWSGTIHTSVYFPKTLQAWFALGDNEQPYMFDFGRWLTGEAIDRKRMYGHVETDMKFLHMDAGTK